MKRDAGRSRTAVEESGDAVSGPTDEELMERFLDGDEAAFEALFERFARPLRRFVFRCGGRGDVADDLLQTTFLSVVRGRGRFRRGARVRTWIYAIAANVVRDWRRKRHFVLTETGDLPDVAAEPGPDADVALERHVHRALDALPEAQRETILLHRFEGLSYAEIAEVLGVGVTAVRVRAHRGYVRLRKLLRALREQP